MPSSKQSQSQSQAPPRPPDTTNAIPPALAHDILSGLDINPSQDRDFFASLLTSGLAPPVEVRKLWELSLMRGMEEWEMMMACANSLREQAYRALRLKREREEQNQGRGRGWKSSSRLESVKRQNVRDDDHELCLLPFLDMVMKGWLLDGDTSCAVAGSVLGKRTRKIGGKEEQMSSAKVGRGGRSKRARKKVTVGKNVSQFWAEDDTAKTSRRGTRVRRETSVSGYAGKAVKRDEPDGEEVKTASPTQLMTVVHRPAEASQGDGEAEGKKSSLIEDADIEHSKLADEPGYPDTQSSQCSPASPLSPNEILEAAFGDVSVADILTSDESLPPAKVRITRKRTHKSPFFSEPPPSPKPPSKGISHPLSKTSPYKTKSPTKKSRPPPGISRLPIPPLSAPSFGLIQEELASDPFRLLIAVTFLIKVRGTIAIPLFRQLMDLFPTPSALADADPAEIINLIRPLGLSVNRCSVIQKYARMWIECPPCKEKRYGVRNYPRLGDARGVKAGEEFGAEPDDFFYIGKVLQGGVDDDDDDDDDDDTTNAIKLAKEHAIGLAWEIGHLTQGPYALDSWRIFCRDKLLGRAEDWKGKGRHPEFQPEWMRVLPRDKELRACLQWMWMREGWEWDPITGEREPLREEMRKAVDEERVAYDECGGLVILDGKREENADVS